MLRKYLTMLNKLFSRLKSKWTVFTLIGMSLSLLGGYEWGASSGVKTVYINAGKVITLVDTLQVTKTVHTQLPARVETVQVTLTDTQVDTVYMITTEVARLDTTLVDGHLSLCYYVTPKYFDFAWTPVPLEVRCKQIMDVSLGVEPPRLVTFSLGMGVGKTWDGKKWRGNAVFTGHTLKYDVYLVADARGYTMGVGRRF